MNQSRRAQRALIAAVSGVVATAAIATAADAQTVVNPQSTITTSANFVGPVPSGVSGVSAVVTCKNTLLAGTTTPVATPVSYSASIPTTGGTGVMNFNLTATPPGSSCNVLASTYGTANLGVGTISIAVGGVARATTAGISPTGAITGQTAELPVQLSTSVVVTVTYPQITVKKLLSGDEPVAGFAYPFTIACSNPNAPQAFIGSSTAAFPGALYISSGAGYYLTVGSSRWYDVRTDPASIPSGGILGTAAAVNGAGNNGAGVNNVVAAAIAFNALNPTTLAPAGVQNGVLVFNGTFTLKGGETRNIGLNDFPGLTPTSQCEVTETNNQGMVTSYSSTVTNADGTIGTPLPGVQAGAVFKSALTKTGQTITVTNSSFGDLIISKVVTGDPKSNIGTFEISVACDKGGPKDTFLLKDRQSKLYNNISVGTNCLITETRSDGAVASYSDNSGDNTTDGRVSIKARGTGCTQPGGATLSTPGGPTPTSSYNDCMANVIVTNDYNPPATTTTAASVTTVAPTTAPIPTAAPPVAAAPAQPVDETPTFTG